MTKIYRCIGYFLLGLIGLGPFADRVSVMEGTIFALGLVAGLVGPYAILAAMR
jgi:hypothetical protein